MQIVEQGRIGLDDDISKSLGGALPRGVTVAQALLHRPGADPDLLSRAIEKISGEAFPTFIMKHVFAPLGMVRSGYGQEGFNTTANDASRFLAALTNGGAWGQGRILLPESLERMQRAREAANPALPGWSYGFAEESRNGWRALQRDGVASSLPLQSRVVFVPDARLAYLIVVIGHADGQFWRMLDDSLYDRLLPPRAAPAGLAGASPGTAEARAASGTYIPGTGALSDAVFLKVMRRPLYAEARDDGTLALSGAQSTSLIPHAGGYWLSQGSEVPALYRGGRLLFGDIAYVRFQLWEQPDLYAWLAVFAGLAAIMAFADPVKAQRLTRLEGQYARYLGPGLAGVTYFFMLLAVVLRLLVFGA